VEPFVNGALATAAAEVHLTVSILLLIGSSLKGVKLAYQASRHDVMLTAPSAIPSPCLSGPDTLVHPLFRGEVVSEAGWAGVDKVVPRPPAVFLVGKRALARADMLDEEGEFPALSLVYTPVPA